MKIRVKKSGHSGVRGSRFLRLKNATPIPNGSRLA
uniref:Uncharacterized protein n=1 Tax=Anguilla anguilla TaxID=7936 RepID=A0A0E9P936_ANGAN